MASPLLNSWLQAAPEVKVTSEAASNGAAIGVHDPVRLLLVQELDTRVGAVAEAGRELRERARRAVDGYAMPSRQAHPHGRDGGIVDPCVRCDPTVVSPTSKGAIPKD